MTNQHVKIVLKGQEYASPQTESVVVINQGVLCGSGAGGGGAKLTLGGVGKGSL